MCGRYARYRAIEELIESIKGFLPDIDESSMPGVDAKGLPKFFTTYNAASSQMILTIGKSKPEHPHKFALLRWGFIPSFAKDLSGPQPINARCETLSEKPMFRSAFNKQRCLIIADGFYEWKRVEGRKIPYYFCVKDNAPSMFAGIYNACTINGQLIVSCAIVTTAANELVAQFHDRMPLILKGQDFALWCDPEKSSADVAHLLKPFPADQIECHRVSDRVNNTRNNDASLLEALSAP